MDESKPCFDARSGLSVSSRSLVIWISKKQKRALSGQLCPLPRNTGALLLCSLCFSAGEFSLLSLVPLSSFLFTTLYISHSTQLSFLRLLLLLLLTHLLPFRNQFHPFLSLAHIHPSLYSNQSSQMSTTYSRRQRMWLAFLALFFLPLWVALTGTHSSPCSIA